MAAWQSLAAEDESIPSLLRRVVAEVTSGAFSRQLVAREDQAALEDDLLYALAHGAIVWNTLRPVLAPPVAHTFYEASLRLGDRLLRQTLEAGDWEEARRMGIPDDVVRRAQTGVMPPELEMSTSESTMLRQRGWLRVVLNTQPPAFVVFLNPSPWAEPVSGGFDVASFRHVIRLAALLAAARGDDARVALVNAAGLLLSLGLPFDSPRGLGISAALLAMVRGGVSEVSESLNLGSQVDAGELRARYLEFPDPSRPQAGRLEPVRWRDLGMASLQATNLSDGLKVSGDADPAVEMLMGSSATGLGPVRDLMGHDAAAGLRALELDWSSIERADFDENSSLLTEAQRFALRGMREKPWGSVLPQAQMRRSLDLATLLDRPIDAVVGGDQITADLRTLAVQSADKGGADSVVLFGHPASSPAEIRPDSISGSAELNRSLSLCRSADGRIALQAMGANAEELALLQSIAAHASLDLESAIRSLPEDDSWAGAPAKRTCPHGGG